MLSGVTVTGDFVRSDGQGRPGEGDRSIVWLFDAVKRQIARAGALPVSLLTARSCAELHRWVERARPPEQADAYWAAVYHDLPLDAALEEILLPRLRRQFVVGHELPPYLLRLLDRLDVPYLDLRIHPVRFLDDLLFAARASNMQTQGALLRMAVPEDNVYAAAGLLEAMCRYTTDCSLPAETLLVVGQRTMDSSQITGGASSQITGGDSSQIVGGTFFDAWEHRAEVAAICAEYQAVLLKPHPYGGAHSLLVAAAAAPNARATSDNVYRLLTQAQVTAVLTVNSSVAYEAGYFDKRVRTLAPLQMRIAWRGGRCEADTHASIDDKVFCSDFWRVVLEPHAPVGPCDGARLPPKPNRLRIAHDSFWNFQEVDTDRIPGGPVSLAQPACPTVVSGAGG
jgi:hypothetical protein